MALLGGIITALVVGLGYKEVPPKPSEAEYLKIGTDEFAANHLPVAVTALQQVIELNPANVTAQAIAGQSLSGHE